MKRNIKFPWASQFIAYHKSHIGHNAVSSDVRRAILRDAHLKWELGRAFCWSLTKEGHAYWENIARQG